MFSGFILFSIYFLNLSGTVSPRHLLDLLIPVFIFISYAFDLSFNRSKVIGVLLLAIFSLYLFTPIFPILKFRHEYSGNKQFSLYVNRMTEDNSVIIAMDDAIFIRYYGNRTTLNHTSKGDRKGIEEFFNKVDDHLSKNIPLYIVETGFSYDDHGNSETV